MIVDIKIQEENLLFSKYFFKSNPSSSLLANKIS